MGFSVRYALQINFSIRLRGWITWWWRFLDKVGDEIDGIGEFAHTFNYEIGEEVLRSPNFEVPISEIYNSIQPTPPSWALCRTSVHVLRTSFSLHHSS